MKTCRRCGIEKQAEAFGRDKRYRDGLASWCRECFRENNRKWAKENRARLTEKAAAWRRDNPEAWQRTYREFHSRNKKKRAKQHAEWAKANRDKRNATCAKRKAAKLNATPPWADLDAINIVYEKAAHLQSVTGIQMHVDHIVPLQHKLICGLHCESNLQILTAQENVRKKNKWSAA